MHVNEKLEENSYKKYYYFKKTYLYIFETISDTWETESNLLLLLVVTQELTWTSERQNLQNDLCDQRRLRSACPSAQSDQSLRWSHVYSTAYGLSKEG